MKHIAIDILLAGWRSMAWTALAVGMTISGPLAAQAVPQPVINSVFPPAGQAGTETEITITGTDLDDASCLHFSIGGLKGSPKLGEGNVPVPGKFLVGVPEGAATGLSDLRLAGRLGISNPRRFFVSRLPVVVVPGTSTSSASALKGKLEAVYAGKAVKNAATFLTFDAEKGQRIFVICHAAQLDSRMEAAATVTDAAGRVLERLKPDGILDFTPAENGTFTLKVHDLMYRGGDDYPFCAVITATPLVDAVFTDGNTATLYGRNLPSGSHVDALNRYGKPLERLQLPDDHAQALISSSMVQPARFGAETKTAQTDASQPEAVSLPLRYAGWFPPRGKARAFTFEAKKGDAYAIEVNCARQGLAADPFLVVEKISKGTEGKETYATVAEVYDAESITTVDELGGVFRDPAYRFEAKEDGQYRVQVRDLFSSSPSAPRHPFELSIQKAGAAFELVTFPVVLPKAKAARTVDFGFSSLWRGGVLAMKVVAFRKPGFTGPIALNVENVPAGVTAVCGNIPQGGTSGYITLKADEKAASWSGAVRVRGTAQMDGQQVTELASRGASLVWKVADSQKEPVLTRLTSEVNLAVNGSDVAPVTIEPSATDKLEVVAGAKYTMPIRVTRRGDAADAVKIRLLGVGAPATAPEIDVAAKATEGKLVLDTAALKLPAGEHHLLLQGTLKFKHQRNADEVRAADEELKKLTAEVASMAAAAKAAAEAVAKAPKEQLATAEAASKQASEKQKEMEKRKSEADKRTKALKAKSAPKDATFVQYSQPMTLLVKEAPKK